MVRDASEQRVWLLVLAGWGAGPVFLQLMEDFALVLHMDRVRWYSYRNLYLMTECGRVSICSR